VLVSHLAQCYLLFAGSEPLFFHASKGKAANYMAQSRGSSMVAKSKLSLPEQYRRLLNQFHSDDRVLVAIVADPDSLASAIALKRLLWRKVAGVTIGCANSINRPDNQTMVRLLKIPLEPLSGIKVEEYKKHVLLDGQPGFNSAFSGLNPQVIIDHHPLADSSSKAEYVDIRPRYGANSTIMTEYLKGGRIKPSTRLATALVYGIKNDTADFSRPSLEQDVKAFQFLFPKANQAVLRKIEFSEMRYRDLSVLRLALDRIVRRKSSIFAYLGRVQSDDNLVQVADFLLKVDCVDFSVVSGIYEDRLVVILRNATLSANAGKTAKTAFGHLGSAGGHKAMARAEVPLSAFKGHLDLDDEEAMGRMVIRRVQYPHRGKLHKTKSHGK
jgi:nanoRNase/pAp phosphatase (c-di-AMP/oligoRNAs hydrolase)